MLIKEIKMKQGTPEKTVRACCDYFGKLKRFMNVEKRNGNWFIVVSFEDELDYLAFMTKK